MKECLTKKESQGDASHTSMGAGLINHMYSNLASNMKVWLDSQLAPKPGVKPMYYQYLKYAASQFEEHDTFISILCLSLLSQTINDVITMQQNRSISHIGETIGRQIQDEVHLQEFLNYLKSDDYRTYIESEKFQNWLKEHDKKMFEFANIPLGITQGLRTRNSDYYRRYYVQEIEKKVKGASIPWSPKTFDKCNWITLGGKLLEVLLASTDLFALQSVAQGVDEIYPTQQFLDIWAANTDYALMHAYISCPTIIPPKEWTGVDNGGYYGELAIFNTLLRLYRYQDGGYYYKQYMKRLKSADITSPMKALNAIQKTPWRIDTAVLEVAKKVIKLGGDRAGLPSTEPFPGLPTLHNPTEKELKEHKHKAFLQYKKEASRKGKMIRVLANLKTAERFKGYERIYFPCNLDFRGRVYPIPSFSFQGDDLNKGLIQFADAPKVTDPSSERWFLIAGAEFAGIDKVSFDDEIKWIADNKQNILNTAAASSASQAASSATAAKASETNAASSASAAAASADRAATFDPISYYTKTEVDAKIPTKTSQLTNDLNYVRYSDDKALEVGNYLDLHVGNNMGVDYTFRIGSEGTLQLRNGAYIRVLDSGHLSINGNELWIQ